MIDRELITLAVPDHHEGWYDGDAAPHGPGPAAGARRAPAGEELGVTTKERMVELTRQGAGEPECRQLARTRDGWKIASVLWQPR